MGRIKSLGCILSFGIFFWGVATALAEPPAVEPKIPPPIQRFSWTGFYAGGNLGGTWSHYRLGSFPERVDLSQQFDQLFPFDIAIPTPAFEPVRVRLPEADSVNGSFFGGGQVGYNMQWNHLVVGLEGDFDGLSTSRKVSYSFSKTTATRITSAQTNGTATREGSTDWNASVRIRVGYTYDRWLLYLTGGPAFADITGRADDIAVTNFFMSDIPVGTITSTNKSSDSDVFSGWTAGAGADWRVTELVSVGVEYRYSNFGGRTFVFDDHGGPIHSGPTGIESSSHQATVRVNLLLSDLFGKR